MGKRKKNRKQQLREIQERRLRYQATPRQIPFSFWRFLTEHDSTIFFIGCVLVAITLVYSLKHYKKSSPEVLALSSSVSQTQINALKQTYPQGFRIFALTKGEVFALNIATLPVELNVEWEVSKILKLTNDEVRFLIGPISYKSKTLAPSLSVKFPRRQGRVSQTTQFNDIAITVELLGEYTNGIFCVLGFAKN